MLLSYSKSAIQEDISALRPAIFSAWTPVLRIIFVSVLGHLLTSAIDGGLKRIGGIDFAATTLQVVDFQHL
jgi:hypothetical protein